MKNTHKTKKFMNILLQLKKNTIKLGIFSIVQEKLFVFSYAKFCVSHYSSKLSMYQSPQRGNSTCFAKKTQQVPYVLLRKTFQSGTNLLTLPVHNSISKKKICNNVNNVSPKIPASKMLISRNFKSSRELSLTDKFISFLTIDGKKNKAYAIFFTALKLCHNKLVTTKHIKDISESPIKILHQAVENIKPSVEIRKVRIAASTYQVPSTTPKKRQETLAIRWIVISAQKTKKNTKYRFAECLAQELVDAFLKQGQSRQRRDQLHSTAELNRAFVRYKWW